MKIFTRLALCIAAGSLLLAGCGKDGKDGAAGKDTSSAVKVASLTTDQWADLSLKGEVTSVSISSPPVVKFKVTDAAGNPVVGLGNYSKTSTSTGYNTYRNLAFYIAKLVPGTNGAPSKWVNYCVTTIPTTTTAAVKGTRPSNDTNGTLVDHGDGSYTYTFYRDITKSKDLVAAGTYTSTENPADLGDLTYDPKLTHRVVVAVLGNAPGTGTNTADGVQVTTGVSLKEPINIVYDFVPATGKAVTSADTQREITLTAQCNGCHTKIGVTTPHGGRVDARTCAVCHNDQRKFGRTEATTSGTGYTGSTYKMNGFAAGDFPMMVHQIHMGNRLSKTGYNYANVLYNEIGYPQNPTNCRTCHTKSAAAPQGDNWNTVPSRLACGACHDGINWSTGAGHVGGSASNDANCALCHKTADIERYHVTEAPVSTNAPTAVSGAVNFTYEVQSAAVASNNDLTVKFRILNGTTPVTFVAPAATVTNPLSGFTGSPSFLLAYSKDGVDFDMFGRTSAQPATVSIATLLGTNNAATGSISGPDATGVYTATIKSASAFPASAKMRYVYLQGYFTQAAGTNGIAAATARHTLSAGVKVTGDATRRVVVDPAKCANCHEVFEGHGGNRNIGKATGTALVNICVTCHNPNLASSGKQYALTYPDATQNFKDMIHAIHASHFRETAFTHTRAKSATSITVYDWSHVTYPAVLNNCEQCHIPGTYASVPSTALATTDIITDGSGTTAGYGAARATLPNATDLVISAYTGACVSCHDGSSAKAHMSANGGQIGVNRSTLTSSEQCAVCHSTGRIADVVPAHK